MIEQIQEKINLKRTEVEDWLNNMKAAVHKKGLHLPIYSSFDIRCDGFKTAIVDSNLFPAGFNNLDEKSKERAVKSFKEYLENHFDEKNILIVPEAHTRNTFYLSNLCALKGLLAKAGYNVTLGSMREDITGDSIKVKDKEGHTLVLEKMTNNDCMLQTASFKQGLILLNNDFSIKNPPLLDKVCQKVIPPLFLGWHHRKKTTHFKYFDCLINDFAKIIQLDPWLLKALHAQVDNVDFSSKASISKISEKVDELAKEIQKKYDKYAIKTRPYLFVKDNSGTYGMGVVSVATGQDLLDLNSRQRSNMTTGKQRSKITSVMIQEGVPTAYKVNGHFAEPVIYSAGGHVVGGFMRVHSEKDARSSLNKPGMKFDILLEDNITRPLKDSISRECEISLFEVLSDIANIAIAYEHDEELESKIK